MLQIASYMFFFKRDKTKQNDYKKKEKSLTMQESNARPQMCEGNPLSIAPSNHCKDCMSNKLYLTFLSPQDKLWRWRRKCSRKTKRVPQKVTLEYHKKPN